MIKLILFVKKSNTKGDKIMEQNNNGAFGEDTQNNSVNSECFQLDDGFGSSSLGTPNSTPNPTTISYNSVRNSSGSDSNIFLGIVGAIVGSIPGCLFWLILGKIGFIAGIAGFVIMLGAMFCYGKLGGDMDTKGIISCIVVTCIAILFANLLDYAIEIYGYVKSEGIEIGFGEVLFKTPLIIKEGGMAGGFVLNLLIGYGLTAVSCAKLFTSK